MPGDIRNPDTRIPNCTVAPCATSGDGDRQIDPIQTHNDPIDATMEKFTFWHHLQAADLISMDINNTLALGFGEGQPSAPIGGGYRVSHFNGNLGFCVTPFANGYINITNLPFEDLGNTNNGISCSMVRQVDDKIDDGMPSGGDIMGAWGCQNTTTCDSTYNMTATGRVFYNAPF